jgi:hypothetical protein
MMGIAPDLPQQPLFSYLFNLERRIPQDHEIRRLAGVLDLDFVLPLVRRCYGRCGHASLDPRGDRQDDDSPVLLQYPQRAGTHGPDRRALGFPLVSELRLGRAHPRSQRAFKARARWGHPLFQELFTRSVMQCVAAGLVDGQLLHTDSTMVKANASKSSVVQTSPELVKALRQAYQDMESKLEALPSPTPVPAPAQPRPSVLPPAVVESAVQALPVADQAGLNLESTSAEAVRSDAEAQEPAPVLESSSSSPVEPSPECPARKAPVNSTRISLTDP